MESHKVNFSGVLMDKQMICFENAFGISQICYLSLAAMHRTVSNHRYRSTADIHYGRVSETRRQIDIYGRSKS